jgi:HlyD family secretion protein
MAQTSEIVYPEVEESSVAGERRHGGRHTKTRRRTALRLSLAGAALAGLLAGGIIWSRRGVVTVQTGKVMRQDLAAVVTASGEIKPQKENQANVNANSFGKITEILVKEGDRVKKGQLLLKTESVQQEADVQAQEAALGTSRADVVGSEAAIQSAAAALRTAQADVRQAQANLKRAQDDFARGQQMLEDRLIAQQVFDQRRSDYEVAQASLQASQAREAQAKAQYQQSLSNRDMASSRVAQSRAALLRVNDLRSKTIYTSPLDAIVTALPVHVGENVVPGIQNQAGSLLFQVSDLSIITAEVKVDETDIVNVKLGQPAEITIDAIPNKTFKGRVTEIGQSAVGRTSGLTTGQTPATNEEAKDFIVVVTLGEPPPDLRPGLSATAKITTATRQNALTVPIQALTVRERRELEDGDQNSKAPAVGQQSSGPSGKDKSKEELQGVFVVRQGRAVFAPVETGIMGATDVELLAGVQEKDEIVTGSYKVLRTLKNHSKVKVNNSPPDQNTTPSPS